jgi:hypothetical protein
VDNPKGPRSALLALLMLLAPLGASGCGTVPISVGGLSTAFDGILPSSGRKVAEDEPCFHVEIRPSLGGKVRKTFPLDRDLVLQDAVELSRANRRFAKMNITIYRTDASGRRVKFGADYDYGKRRVKYETDYALHPGDVVVIEEDLSNPVGDLLTRMTGSGPRYR